jgi:hypothetical protein
VLSVRSQQGTGTSNSASVSVTVRADTVRGQICPIAVDRSRSSRAIRAVVVVGLGPGAISDAVEVRALPWLHVFLPVALGDRHSTPRSSPNET